MTLTGTHQRKQDSEPQASADGAVSHRLPQVCVAYGSDTTSHFLCPEHQPAECNLTALTSDRVVTMC